MESLDGEWIGWTEARDRVEAAGLSAKGKLPSVLVDWAQSSVVACRATTLLWDNHSQFDAPIPPRAWEIARGGQHGRIDWATGYVQCRIALEPGQRSVILKAYGTQFSKAEMDRLAPFVPCTVRAEIDKIIAQPTQKNKGGAPRSAAWNDFMAELAAVLHEVGVPPGSGTQGSEQFMETIFGRLEERGKEYPQRTTVQPVVNAVLERLRADN